MANTASTAHEETQSPKSYADLQEQVRLRAYELYEKRGREEGHALEDWLQAESELVQKRAKAATA